MGHVYEVSIFTIEHGYQLYWQGEKQEEAFEAMEKAKAAGYKCIKLEWRP